MAREMSWEEFEQILVARGWPPEDAHRERLLHEREAPDEGDQDD